jgi:integrase
LASPILGKLNVADIETSHVLKVLEPVWQTIPQTASRVRSRIEAILAWATVSEFRPVDSPNPARWTNHLSKILPKPGKLKQVKRMASLPIDQMPQFVGELRQQDGLAALALEFVILCAVRTADIIAARWSDIDVKARVWTIKQFSKTHKEHRVPLSDAALHVLDKVHDLATEKTDLVFPRLHKNSMLKSVTEVGTSKANDRSRRSFCVSNLGARTDKLSTRSLRIVPRSHDWFGRRKRLCAFRPASETNYVDGTMGAILGQACCNRRGHSVPPSSIRRITSKRAREACQRASLNLPILQLPGP